MDSELNRGALRQLIGGSLWCYELCIDTIFFLIYCENKSKDAGKKDGKTMPWNKVDLPVAYGTEMITTSTLINHGTFHRTPPVPLGRNSTVIHWKPILAIEKDVVPANDTIRRLYRVDTSRILYDGIPPDTRLDCIVEEKANVVRVDNIISQAVFVTIFNVDPKTIPLDDVSLYGIVIIKAGTQINTGHALSFYEIILDEGIGGIRQSYPNGPCIQM